MVSFDLSFRSTLIGEIAEDEGALWTKSSISWISINMNYYQGNILQVDDGGFICSARVSLGAILRESGCSFEFLIKKKPKTKTGPHTDIRFRHN